MPAFPCQEGYAEGRQEDGEGGGEGASEEALAELSELRESMCCWRQP